MCRFEGKGVRSQESEYRRRNEMSEVKLKPCTNCGDRGRALVKLYEAAVEVLKYQCKVCRHPELCDDCLFEKLKAAVEKVKGGTT